MRRLLVAVLVVVATYVALLLNPEILLAHEIRMQNLTLHASTPLPEAASRIAEEVLDRIQRSPFYESDHEYHVFLCSSFGEFALFARGQRNVGAISMVGLTGHAFVRPSDISGNRLIGPRGTRLPAERDLVYFIAHELTHTMVARRVGRVAFLRLEAWQQEGYADYVAKLGRFDYPRVLAAFHAGAPALDPARSGLYLRYQLMVESQLRAGLRAAELLSRPRAARDIEAGLHAEARRDRLGGSTSHGAGHVGVPLLE